MMFYKKNHESYDRAKNFLTSYRFWFWFLIVLLLVFFALGILDVFNVRSGMQLITDDQHFLADHITELHYFFIVILTFALVFVGYAQLHGIRKNTEGDYLMDIDKRYGSSKIIKARQIIRDCYCDVKKHNTGEDKDYIRKEMAKRIGDIAVNEDKNNEDYMLLMNLLDFLETVAFFANHNLIEPDQIKGLMGGSLVRYYNVFEKFLEYKENQVNNDSHFDKDYCLNRARCIQGKRGYPLKALKRKSKGEQYLYTEIHEFFANKDNL